MLLHVHHDSPGEEEGDVRVAGMDPRSLAMMTSLVAAFVMLFGKFWAYRITGSTAILSDALESVVHLFATVIAAVSLWYAAQPPDRQHPYGHGKIAYFSSGFEGALILFAAGLIVYEGVRALIVGPELESLGIGLLITGALALVNLALGLFLVRTGKKHNALVLVANGHHVLTDMWTSVGVVVGVALVWATGIVWIDPVVAILVGLNIVWTAFQLLRRSYEGLMERVDAEEALAVEGALATARDEGLIRDFHHLRHRRVNDQVWIETHLLFADGATLADAHTRASRAEARLRALFPKDRVLITTHLEPESHPHPEGSGHDDVLDAGAL